MHRFLKTSEAVQQAADTAAGISVGSAGAAIAQITWLANVNEILTTIGALIAIASGAYSLYLRSKKNEPKNKD